MDEAYRRRLKEPALPAAIRALPEVATNGNRAVAEILTR